MTQAHFHTFWPEQGDGYGKRGQPISWTYFWGHPYEKVVMNAPPSKFFAALPDGSRTKIPTRAVRMKDEGTGEMRRAYMFTFKPTVLGDHYICMESPLAFLEDEGHFLLDFVKQPLHVSIEKGWFQPVGMEVEIIPLTRPYGIEEGSIFRGQALHNGKPIANALVTIEKFNGFYVAPESLPRDPFGNENTPLITQAVLTDSNGYFVCTLNEPGWWVLAVSLRDGERARDRQKYPLEKRGSIWVNVYTRYVQKRTLK